MVLIIAACIEALATVLAAIVACVALVSSSTAFKTSELLRQESLRPAISVVPLAPNGSQDISLRLTNHGPTPARHIRLESGEIPVYDGEQPETAVPGLRERDLLTDFLPPGQSTIVNHLRGHRDEKPIREYKYWFKIECQDSSGRTVREEYSVRQVLAKPTKPPDQD